jgi:hypothetical protein
MDVAKPTTARFIRRQGTLTRVDVVAGDAAADAAAVAVEVDAVEDMELAQPVLHKRHQRRQQVFQLELRQDL